MTDYRDDEQYLPDYAREEPRQGMTTGTKVLLVIAGLMGVMLLLCCGGIFWFGSRLSNSVTEDPAEIAKIRESISSIEVPEGFEPQAGANINMFVFQMDLVGYERDDDESLLLLMQMQAAGQGQEEIEQQFRQQALEQSDAEEIDIESTEIRTYEINGRESDFVFAKGTLTEDDTKVRQVSGIFPGKGGAAFLMFQVAEEDWNEAEVETMILSLDENGEGKLLKAPDEEPAEGQPAEAGDESAPAPAEPDAATDEAGDAPGQPEAEEAAAAGDAS